MNVLSLFDGKSSGYTALELANKTITNYYSSEVDKYAIQVSNAIHPNQTRMGDITKWREWDIDWGSIDLVIAGSPCQGFSFAGKQLAFDDPRSKLFFVFVDILNHVKAINSDVKFLLENVKMKKEFMKVIDEQLGVENVLINSALVSAQSRPRLYWSNIHIDELIQLRTKIEDFIDFNIVMKSISDGKKRRVMESKFGVGRYITMDSANCGTIIAQYAKQPSDAWYVFRDNGSVTMLSPRECFLLQTTPKHHIDKILSCGVSNSQLYKIAGNGWTDEIIAHIFKNL